MRTELYTEFLRSKKDLLRAALDISASKEFNIALRFEGRQLFVGKAE